MSEHTSMAAVTARPGRKRRGMTKIVLAGILAALVGGATPAAVSAIEPYALTSPVTIRPSDTPPPLITAGAAGSYEFIENALEVATTESSGAGFVEFKYPMENYPLSELFMGNNVFDLKTVDQASSLSLTIYIQNPDGPGTAVLHHEATHNGGSNSGTYDSGVWWSNTSFVNLPSPGTGFSFFDTLRHLNDAYPGGLEVQHIGFQLGSDVLGSATIKELKVGNQMMRFDIGVFNIKINYASNGTPVGTPQTISKQDKSTLTQSELQIPAGYHLESPFPDTTITGHETFEVKVLRDTANTTIEYVDETTNEPLGSEVLSLPIDDVINAASLQQIPAGYELVDPAFTETVTTERTVRVPVKRSIFDTVVQLVDENGANVGEPYTLTTPAGTTLTAKDLQALPEGYTLAEPGFTYEVTASGTLTVKVKADTTTTPGGNGGGTTGGQKPGGNTGTPGGSIAHTGAQSSVVAAIAGLTALIAGAGVVLAARKRRA